MSNAEKRDRPKPLAAAYAIGGSSLSKLAPELALISVVLFFGVADQILADGTFWRPGTLRTVVIQTCVVAIAALGMTIIIIAGGIDLSSGAAVALCATTLAWGMYEDVGCRLQHGDSFASATKKLNEAHDEVANASGDDESSKQELLYEVERRNHRLRAISESKLEITKRRLAIMKPRTKAALEAYDNASSKAAKKRLASKKNRYVDEQSRLERALAKNEEKLAKLSDLNFRPDTDHEWMLGVPNAPSTTAIAVCLGILTGVLCGLVNGLLISMLRVVPFIVTLGTMTIFMGIGNWLSENKPIRPTDSDQVPFWLQDMVSASSKALWFDTFPSGVFLLVAVAILLSLTLRYTVFGRHVYALGSNEATARLCGINVSFTKIVVYSLAGVFVGLAGLCHFATESTGNPDSGLGMELKIIAAVVIGGGSLNGGRGAVRGTLAGAAMMQVIDVGCTHLELDVSIQRIIIGAIIITAVTIDQLRQRKQQK